MTDPATKPPPTYVQVALNLPLRREFTYALPAGATARPGNRVRVVFHGRKLGGIVTAVADTCELPPAKVRPVEAVLDADLLLPESLLELARRMAHTYGCSLGEALDATLPAVAKRRGQRLIPHLERKAPLDLAQQAVQELEDKHQEQSRVLRTVLEFGGPMPVRDVTRRTGTSDSPWQTLVKHGLLRRVLIAEELEELVPAIEERAVRHELNEHQQRAVEQVARTVAARAHRTFLLHGVTGSGKTEVYLRILEEVRNAGRSGIVLVPEISLTPQTVGRFASRFPDVAVLHSGLTDAERGRQWQRLVQGRARIAVGARSALFAPVQDLGLIVVDEEHETSFKQDSTPRYHAREMAIVRGQIENAVVVLGSATPTLESIGKARRGVYELLTLPERAGAGRLPQILVQDLRGEPKEARRAGVVLSRTLLVMMEERLKARDQVLLFLNRRGYSPVLLCPGCGEAVKCDACSVSMTWHVRRGRLVCHWCCAEKRRPETCPTCQHAGMHELGVGTERLEAAVKQRFPQAIVARMDADTMAERGAHERVLAAFRKKHIDVLIGTQMIAKGLDFPDVTLVGVVSADTGLFVPDYRAAERTFQLLHQVAGRAGRGEKAGTVVIQTFCPDNYAVMAAANNDYDAFVQQELGFRKVTGYPPFARLLRVLAEARNEDEAKRLLLAAVTPLRPLADVEVLGPAPAVIHKVKDHWRWHMLVKAFTPAAFDAAMAAVGTVEDLGTRSCRVTLDVDPSSLM
ncbi:MAG: primosomal protein N' [Planctomycetes bacterium]|nr:primosomal protein N' [Planctomycetota bacterium]MCC7396353.1 primosomal protein N' [Planctomycetota bacterium]